MNPQLRSAIKKGDLVLFLGAGASFGSKQKNGDYVPLSEDLSKELAQAAELPYGGEPLDIVYEAVREVLGSRLDALLEPKFKHLTPSREYTTLSKYVWRRIYTLNIDDALDGALTRHSQQKIDRRLAKDPVVDRNQFFESLDYIKLNGSIDRLADGLIFSPSEYAKAAVSDLPWYSQCASDFVRSPILFIGTTLNEPLLKYHIERYQNYNHKPSGTSYLIAKSATPIQIASLKRYKIEFIQGVLSDFTTWLEREFPDPPVVLDVACESIPQLRSLIGSKQPGKYAELFEHVLAVKPDNLPGPNNGTVSTIRKFYKGFKPEWQDIVDQVPAELDVVSEAARRVQNLSSPGSFLPIIGPAGSGKTTLLMQLAWHFCRQDDFGVYFIDAVPTSLVDTLQAIEAASNTGTVLIFFDNIEFFIEQLDFVLKSGRLKKAVLVGAERENVWNKRAKQVLEGAYLGPLAVRQFTESDSLKLLEKLELYGSWTRLGKMKPAERVRELLGRSKKQLLIALLEATLGRGFERIIEDEFSKIPSDEEKLFLVTIAIATDRRCAAPASLVDRALEKMGILSRSGSLADDLTGIIHVKHDGLSARHPVYAKYLLDKIVDPAVAAKAINGLLQAFSDYKAPVIQNVPKNEAVLYKGIINHKFLFELMNGRKSLIIPTYQALEKRFERDGLFWLQYGLALRDLDEHQDALEKLRVAVEAYPMPHTQHALAQQLLQVAELTKEKAAAIGLAEDAKSMLERLDDVIASDDTYPIVTLGEGYTRVLRKHAPLEEARAYARAYSLVLGQRSKQSPEHERLREAYERLFRFAATGEWVD